MFNTHTFIVNCSEKNRELTISVTRLLNNTFMLINELRSKIKESFSISTDDFIITYKDNQNNRIIVRNNAELLDFLKIKGVQGSLNLSVHINKIRPLIQIITPAPRPRLTRSASDTSGRNPLRFDVPCSSCFMPIKSHGWSCKSCTRLNLCSSCIPSRTHNKEHVFQLIPAPKPGVPKCIICNETGNYKCTKCPSYIICGGCRFLPRRRHDRTHILIRI